MLKNIPCIISPELLKALCEPGHGDEFTVSTKRQKNRDSYLQSEKRPFTLML